MKKVIFGYVRVSTLKQKFERQVKNILEQYPDAIIIDEKYTGTKLDRPAWAKLMRQVEAELKRGNQVVIVFDEVSRMSRNAAEGFAAYQELYGKGVELVFLKESTLNTEHFRQTAQIAMTGTDVDCILEGVNRYLMILAEKQIEAAFLTAEHEVEFLHRRTSEGLKQAQINGKRVGTQAGDTFVTKKSVAMKKKIRELSRDFDGNQSDKDLMELLGIARNTFYKYKREMIESMGE